MIASRKESVDAMMHVCDCRFGRESWTAELDALSKFYVCLSICGVVQRGADVTMSQDDTRSCMHGKLTRR